MIIQSSKVIGLKVLTLDNGKEVENVDDVIYDPASHKVIALLVRSKGIFKDAKVILVRNVKSIGSDKVIIDNQSAIQDASSLEERLAGIARSDDYLTQTTIVTEQGEDLGKVVDLFFDSETGEVTEFLVSQGALKNIHSGMKKIRLDQIIRVGEDATIVKGYTEAIMEEQAKEQGLQGALNQAKDKAQELVENVKDKATEARDRVDTEINKPETQSKIDDLKEDAKKGVENVKDKASEIGNKVRDGAEELGEDLSQKTEDLTSDAKEKIEETSEQIKQNRYKDVVGKYLTKDILTSQDQVLARKGDQITNELISKAESANVSDQVIEYSKLETDTIQ